MHNAHTHPVAVHFIYIATVEKSSRKYIESASVQIYYCHLHISTFSIVIRSASLKIAPILLAQPNINRDIVADFVFDSSKNAVI